MNWYARQRQAFIAEMLDIYGFINRIHIIRKFGCSECRASHDLTRFATEHPDQARYDPRCKAYVAPNFNSERNRNAQHF